MAEYRVVVAEAERNTRALLIAQVEQLGHTVIGETDEPDSLLVLMEAHQPDAVVVDWWLPGPADAESAIQTLARRYPATQLIALVDKERGADRIAAMAAGAWTCITTPHTTVDMLVALEVPRPRHVAALTPAPEHAVPAGKRTRRPTPQPDTQQNSAATSGGVPFMKRAV